MERQIKIYTIKEWVDWFEVFYNDEKLYEGHYEEEALKSILAKEGIEIKRVEGNDE